MIKICINNKLTKEIKNDNILLLISSISYIDSTEITYLL